SHSILTFVASTTCTAASVTSGPIPSPGISVTVCMVRNSPFPLECGLVSAAPLKLSAVPAPVWEDGAGDCQMSLCKYPHVLYGTGFRARPALSCSIIRREEKVAAFLARPLLT